MAGQPTIFLRPGRPASANKSVPEKYRNDLRAAYLKAGGVLRHGLVYGSVFWFVRRYDPAIHPDADNISKPVWDALEGVAYDNDKSVRLRWAGIVDLGGAPGDISFQSLDLTDLPPGVLVDLSTLVIAGRDDFLYVELGAASAAMLAFNMAAKAGP